MAAKKTRKPLFPDGVQLFIKCKFRKTQIVPHEAIDRMYMLCQRETNEDWQEWRDTPLMTTDGVLVRISLLMAINNQDGESDELLDRMGKEVYGDDMTFEYMKANWQARMRISGYWHLIEMERI